MSKGKNHRNKSKSKATPKDSHKENKRSGSRMLSKGILISLSAFLVACLGFFVNVSFFKPKIIVVTSAAWDLSNPIQASFTIKNESNFICYTIKSDLDYKLTVNKDATLHAPEESIIPKLCPNDGHTISIEKFLTTSPNAIEDAEVYINLAYCPTFLHVNFCDSYRFKARKTPSGYIWESLYLDREKGSPCECPKDKI